MELRLDRQVELRNFGGIDELPGYLKTLPLITVSDSDK